MPTVTRDDGAEIHWEARGEGPTVVLASYWSWSPGVYDELFDLLAVDHRVVTYHLRGTGQSSRRGPYDIETDASDLEAVIEEAGGPALVIGVADSTNRAAKVAARRPDLVPTLACFGAPPFGRASLYGQDAMLSSDTVVDAFIGMLESSFRAAMRTFMEAANPQMSEAEARERVDAQVDFCPQEAVVPRLREWAEDDPQAEARQLGNRLWLFTSSTVAGPWLPPQDELLRIVAELLPDAHVETVEPGPVSRPDLAADLLRGIAAPLREGTAQRK